MPLTTDARWDGLSFGWRDPAVWMPMLTEWLAPRLLHGGVARLRPGVERDICWDDEQWMDLLAGILPVDPDSLFDDLGTCLGGATMRTYHGTRTEDAGSFFANGLRVHHRGRMTEELRALVEGSPDLTFLRGAALDRAISEVDNTLDHGRLHLAADDVFLLEQAAHYLIYGSEWILAVLGPSGHRFLRNRGAPTLLDVNLPLRMADATTRRHLARVLVREWMRRTCNRPDWIPSLDFTFTLGIDVPPRCLVGHRHPSELLDPMNRYAAYRSPSTACALCASA